MNKNGLVNMRTTLTYITPLEVFLLGMNGRIRILNPWLPERAPTDWQEIFPQRVGKSWRDMQVTAVLLGKPGLFVLSKKYELMRNNLCLYAID